MATDVTSRDDIDAMIGEAGSRYGPIDIVVHNAGIYPFSPVVKMKEAEVDLVIDTNLKSTFSSPSVLPQMIEPPLRPHRRDLDRSRARRW